MDMPKHRKRTTWDESERPNPELELALRLEPVMSDPAPPASDAVQVPFRRVMLAVLADAVTTFLHTAPTATVADERAFVQTVRWFASNDTSDPLSFLGICDALGLDAACLRQGLKHARARARATYRERVLH